MDLVVGVTGIENRVEQLFLGLEVVQQTRRAHPGLLRDLRQRGVPPAVARQQPLSDGEYPLPAILTLARRLA